MLSSLPRRLAYTTVLLAALLLVSLSPLVDAQGGTCTTANDNEVYKFAYTATRLVSPPVGLTTAALATVGLNVVEVELGKPAAVGRTYTGHTTAVISALVFNGGKSFISRSSESLKLWDTGVTTAKFSWTTNAQAIGLLADSSLLISSTCCAVTQVNVGSAAVVTTYNGHAKSVTIIQEIPSKNEFLTASHEDGAILHWQVGLSTPLCRYSRGVAVDTVNGILQVPNTSTFVSYSDDASITVWTWKDPAPVMVLTGHASNVQVVALLPDNVLLSGSGDSMVIQWDLASPLIVMRYQGHTNLVNIIVPVPGSKNLFLTGSWDSTVKLWRVGTASFIANYVGHANSVTSLVALLNGAFLTTDLNDTVRQWAWGTYATALTAPVVSVYSGHAGYVRCVSVLSTGDIISGGADNTAMQWTPGAPAATPKVRYLGHSGTVRVILALPTSGNFLTGSLDFTIKQWTPGKPDAIATYTGHSNYVRFLLLLKNGNFISGSNDNSIRVSAQTLSSSTRECFRVGAALLIFANPIC